MVSAISMKINSTVIWESLNWSQAAEKVRSSAQCLWHWIVNISFGSSWFCSIICAIWNRRIDDCCNCRLGSKIPFWPLRLRLIGQISFAWLQIVQGGWLLLQDSFSFWQDVNSMLCIHILYSLLIRFKPGPHGHMERTHPTQLIYVYGLGKYLRHFKSIMMIISIVCHRSKTVIRVWLTVGPTFVVQQYGKKLKRAAPSGASNGAKAVNVAVTDKRETWPTWCLCENISPIIWISAIAIASVSQWH